MNTSLNNNRRLLRTSHFFPKQKSYFNRKKEYIKAAEGFVELKAASKEQLAEIRKKILRQRRRENIFTLLIIVALIPLVAYFSTNLFRPEVQAVDLVDTIAIKKKEDKYQFYITDGDNYLKKGKWHNAIFQYNKALELFPSQYDTHYRLAYALTYRCRNEKTNCEIANRNVQSLLEKYPDKAELIELEQVLVFVDE